MFKYDGIDSLLVKIFSAAGDRVECYPESSSSGTNESSDEEDGTPSEPCGGENSSDSGGNVAPWGKTTIL